jgi:hypothetical protein
MAQGFGPNPFACPEMKEPRYQVLGQARLEMTEKLLAFKELVRTGEPFSPDVIRTIARELYHNFLRLENAIEPCLPDEILRAHAIADSLVQQSVQEVKTEWA